MARVNNDIDENLVAGESAQANLQYIRHTLDAAGRLSSVSGSGMMAVGLVALAAVLLNLRITGSSWIISDDPIRVLAVWAILLTVSILITAASMARKARRTGQLFWSPVLRKALWVLSAPMILGGILTAAMITQKAYEFLPMVWLGCYGAALTAAGVMSVSPVRWMGLSFLGLCLGEMFATGTGQLVILGTGFGFFHIAFGAYVYWRHNG